MRKEYENNLAKLIEKKFDIEMDKFKINNFVLDLLENKDKEIERLNNIIEELEKWAKEQKEYNDNEYPREFNDYEDVLNKIQELKGNNNNE